MNGAFPAAKLGLNNILSKSNPNLYLEPERLDESSKDSGESLFENDLIQNESTYVQQHQPRQQQAAQSPYLNNILIEQQDEQQFNSLLYNKQSELRLNDKLRKQPMPAVHSSNQYSTTTNLIDELFTGDPKRSHSQPMFANERRTTSQQQQHFVQSENGLDLNQYALVQNSTTGSSLIDYSIDDLTKTQSIVTNVYLNCNHKAHRSINPIRKRKIKLIKTYSSQRNLNYEDGLTELEERNQFNSLNNLIRNENDLKDMNRDLTNDLFANDVKEEVGKGRSQTKDKNKAKNEDGNLIDELLGDKDADNQSTGSLSVTELKNLNDSESVLDQQKLDKPIRLNQLREHGRKQSKIETSTSNKQQNQIRFDSSKIEKECDEDKKYANEDSSIKTDSRCSHYLHYKPGVYTAKYSNDFSHVKPKVDTRNNIAYLKAQSNLLRSKSNLEDLALEELDEAGEIMQNAEKSLRK